MLKDKNIVLGISGGIAAYKACEVISLLKRSGANVYVIMTKNATEFITPLTVSTLAKSSQNLLIKNNCELVIGNNSKSFINGRHEAIFVNCEGIIDRAETKEEIAGKLVKFLNLK